MRDPKKQAQAQAQEMLGKAETERKEKGVFCKWQKILRNREVVTDSVEMSTIPFLPTVEDEENYRRAELDAMKEI